MLSNARFFGILLITGVLLLMAAHAHADVKCAIIQFSDHYPHEVAQDADRLEAYIRTAAGNGARLIVAPENCLYRYSPWDQNGVTQLELANSFNTLLNRFKALAAELGVCIVYGTREPSGDGSKPTYQSAVFIDHTGNHLKTYRKRVPSSAEYSYTKAETSWTSFNTPVGKVFMQICKDMDGDGYVNSMPTDIDLLIGINKDNNRGWVKVDAGCAKASCYGIGVNYAGDSGATGGNSGYCDPSGNMISEAGAGNYGANETILYETLPLTWTGSGPQAGQIIIDPDHPQWLKRKGGSNLFVCGPGDPEGFLYRGTRNSDGTRSGDQMTLLNKLKNNGGNCIYMQTIRSHGGDGGSTENPFEGSNAANPVDPDILDQWETWFDFMDANNILIYLYIYDDGARPWNTGDSVGTAERNYVETLVNRFKQYKNLIWIVGEESEEAYSHTRVRNIAQVIADADEYDHIIGNHHLSGATFKAWTSTCAMTHYAMQCNTTSPHGKAIEARNNAESAGSGNGYMVIYSENTSRRDNDTTDIRSMNWEVAMGGLMPMRLGMDIAGTSTTALQQCRYLQEFFEGTDFYTMKNNDLLKSGGTEYVLANPGQSYIAYAGNLSGSMGITSMTAGTYKLVWLDCVDGDQVTQTNVSVSSGTNSFSRPGAIGAQCAVWVTKTGGTGPQPGQVAFSASAYSVNEGGGSVTITVTRTGGSDGTASVQYATSNGSAAAGSDYTAKSGTLSWSEGDSGNKTFSVSITDDGSVESSETINLNLSSVSGASMGSPSSAVITIADNDVANQAPTADNKSVSTPEETQVYIQLTYTDPDGPGPYTVSILSGPANGTLTGTDNDRYYTPDAGFTGSDSFTWRVNDGDLNSNTATVSISVTAVPPAAPTGLNAAAVSATQINLTWADNSSNESGFRIERAQGTVSKTVTLKTYNGTNETPTIEAGGTVNSFQAGAKQTLDRSDTWTAVPAALDGACRLLTARDDKGDAGYNTMYTITLSHAMTVYATVSPEYGNTPMEFMDASWSDTSMTAAISNGKVFNIWSKGAAAGDLVLGTDNDGTKQGATYIFPEVGSGGAFTEVATVGANVSFWSDSGLTAGTEYTYRVCAYNSAGNSAWSNEAAATTSSGANNPPNASASADTTNGVVPLTVNFNASGSTDSDGTIVSYAWDFGPASGSGVMDSYTYTAVGTYAVTLTVTDDDGAVDTDSLTITVSAGPNNPPVVDNKSISVAEDGSTGITLTGSDADSDPLTFAVIAGPAAGNLSGTAPNLTYTPLPNFNGSDSFTYKANDGQADSNTATVSITVTPVNDAPQASSQNVNTAQDTGLVIVLSASDIDGDSLTYAIAASPANGNLSGSGNTRTYTPDAGWFGSDSFTFRVNDGTVNSNTATVSITVTEASGALVVGNISRTGYSAADLLVGDTYYIDRSYTIAALPAELENLTWIMTANNDKKNAESDYLSFDVNQDVTIYIGYDRRASSLPAFMSGWTDEGLGIAVTDGSASPLNVYSMTFTAGTIVLGGNIEGGATGAGSSYVILIEGQGGSVPPPPNTPPVAVAAADTVSGTVPLTVNFTGSGSYDTDGTVISYAWDFGDGGTSAAADPSFTFTGVGDFQATLTVTDDDGETGSSSVLISVLEDPGTALEIMIVQPAAYAVTDAYVGSLPYVDRSYSITDLPGLFSGRKMIRTANNDKTRIASDHLVFNVTAAVDVYVAYDKRASVLPVWMAGFMPAGMTVSSTDGGACPMPIYKMTFPAGAVTLGGNVEGGATGAGSNYYVFVLEQGTKAGPVSAPAAGSVIEDTWFNAGDSDGDGLPDSFEQTLSLQLYNTDTDEDTIPDENEIGADGNSLFETATGLTFPPPAFVPGGSEGTKSGCMPGTAHTGGLFVLFLGVWTLIGLKRDRKH